MRIRNFLTALAGAGVLLIAARAGAGASSGAALDALAAASISVRVPTIGITTATVEYYKDKYNYGTRTLCYDPAPAAAKNNCVTKNANGYQGSFQVTGLKADTKYNFRVEAKDGRHSNYNTTGSFTTQPPAAALRPAADGPGTGTAGVRVDASGRTLLPGTAVRASATFPAGIGAGRAAAGNR